MKKYKIIIAALSAALVVSVTALSFALYSEKEGRNFTARNVDALFTSALAEVNTGMAQNILPENEAEYNRTQLVRLNHCSSLFGITSYRKNTDLQNVILRMRELCINGSFHKYSGQSGLYELLGKLQLNPGDSKTARQVMPLLENPPAAQS